jgi:Mn2+/Fe2+ NRAMP family transporter
MRKTLVWLVISAAFIGPGTVTTAAKAGAAYGTSLLWTLLFAIVACVLLQEGAARIYLASGKQLGQAILEQFRSSSSKYTLGLSLTFAVVLGCAAYEAGNILGAVAGISLSANLNTQFMTVAIVLTAGILLYFGKFRLITAFLGSLVGIMGIGLIIIVFNLDLNGASVARGLVIPTFPAGGELLILGLIGTTVVPYNLFLGTRLAEAQEIRTMRRGLTISVVIGGLISVALVLIGSQVEGDFSFTAVSKAIAGASGPWATYLFAFGLFAAGLTSAITAPWAAAVMLSSTISFKNEHRAFRVTWLLVLLTGLIFGVTDIQPIPIIILAQALNGILLPFLSITIFLILNNAKIMGSHLNNNTGNLALLAVVWVTSVLGLLNLLKALYTTFRFTRVINTDEVIILGIVALAITYWLGSKILRKHK